MKILTQSLTFNLLLLSMLTKAADKPMVESFSMMPSICVVAKNSNCQQEIHFQWRLSHASNSCLFLVDREQPLYCSDMQQLTSIVLMLNVEKKNEFIVRVAGAEDIELRRQLKVRELGVDVRQSRRHLWSVF